MPLNRGVKITWLGHTTLKVVSAKAQVVIIDPWVTTNPACPDHAKAFDRLDLMLITHGHFDHIADAVGLASPFKPTVLDIYELTKFKTCRAPRCWSSRRAKRSLEATSQRTATDIGGLLSLERRCAFLSQA